MASYAQKRIAEFETDPLGSLSAQETKMGSFTKSIWRHSLQSRKALAASLDGLWWMVFQSKMVKKVGPGLPDEEVQHHLELHAQFPHFGGRSW